MRVSQIRGKLSRNEPVLVTTLHLCDAALFEMASLMGFDGLWIDMEHHAHSLADVQNLMRAARIGRADVLTRPAKGEFMRLGRMLEAGAQGIIYPRCDNAEEAAELVKWAKFPPLGKRGCDGGSADNPYCFTPTATYVQQANEQTFLVAQIEDPDALEHADAIAAVEGIDVLFLGPGDFSALGGFPGQINHPRIAEATQRIAAAARRTGKHWGRPVNSALEARELIDLGARFINYSSDLLIVKEGFERIQYEFSPMGFSFARSSDHCPSAIKAPHFAMDNGTLRPSMAVDGHAR
jgi:4-hydroxy-2-oxoheptanedioate aldolase